MTRRVAFYNPRDAPPEVLEELFVGRRPLLDEIIDDLAHQAAGPSRQHWLLRGLRGMGKTHLAGLIDHRARTERRLADAYIPIWLGEADVYEVYSAGTLLLQVAERLRDELVRARAVGADRFAAALADLAGGGDDEALFDDVCALVADEARARGRILLVLMENLDALLADRFDAKKRAVETKRFRSVLLHEKAFLFVSTTPTRYLPLADPKTPLYGHLKERVLGPLTEDQTRELFAKLARVTGGEAEARGGVDSIRLKVLHQLTGGLPRSLVMAFHVMTNARGVEAIQAELRALLDQQTAYFEARLARFASREGAIVTAMALADRNLTMQEIARRTRLPERSLPTLVRRLVDDGHVEPTYRAGGKGTLYGLTDGLFRVWYQYRKGRGNLELIRFMAFWYDPDALEGTMARLAATVAAPEAADLDRWSAEAALREVEAALRLATSDEGKREREALWEACRRQVEAASKKRRGPTWEATQRRLDRAVKLFNADDDTKAVPLFRKVVTDLKKLPEKTSPDGDDKELLRLTCMVMLGESLAYSKQFGDAERVLHEAVMEFSSYESPPARRWIASARRKLGDVLFVLGKKEQASRMFRDAFESLPVASDELSGMTTRLLRDRNVVALIEDEAEAELFALYRQTLNRAMIQARPEDEEALADLATDVAHKLASEKRADEEIRFRKYAFERTKPGVVALLRGMLLAQSYIISSGWREALAQLTVLCENFLGFADEKHRSSLSFYIILVGKNLSRANDFEAASRAFRLTIDHFVETRRDEGRALAGIEASAMLVELLATHNDPDGAISVCERALALLAKDPSDAARPYAVKIHMWLGVLQLLRGKASDALGSLDVVLQNIEPLPGDHATPLFLVHLFKGLAHGERGEREQGERAIDAAIEVFSEQAPEQWLIDVLFSEKLLTWFSLPVVRKWLLALMPKLRTPEGSAAAALRGILLALVEVLGPDPARWNTDEPSDAYWKLLGAVPPEERQLFKHIVAKLAKTAKPAPP